MKKLFILFAFISLASVLRAQEPAKVMVMEIKSDIDPRMLRYVKLALDHAEQSKADYVIIEMDTYGGVLTDAKDIVDRIMAYKHPIWVFINSDAASAGALISIACDSIYMSPGASIGAATVVEGAGGQAAPDKYQSYMRSIMRSTAEEKHRDPRIAEGMVDERIVVDSLKQAGKVITLTTSEAIKYRYCEAKVESIEEILKRNKIEKYTLDRFKLGPTEKIISFFLNPFISGLLILVIIGGIYFELQTPGAMFPIGAALIALVLYLVPYYLNGLADYWEILALFTGIVLIVLEIFVIPGFGVAGVLGATLTLLSLVLIMLNNDFFNFDFVPLGDIVVAVFAAVGGLSGSALVLFLWGGRISQSSAFKRFALTDTQQAGDGYTAGVPLSALGGKTGAAFTVLRPSGKVMIEGKVYDAFTRGEYIEKEERIEVIDAVGSTLRVKKASA